MRIDQYLAENNHFETRSKAQQAIKEGVVKINDKIVTKNSYEVLPTDKVEILANPLKYVSRGGLKLEAAITNFNLDFKDKVVLDIGASTGGFTDCSLQFGASYVYAVDVGTNQLHSSLLNNSKVCSMEQTNILDVDTFPKQIDIITMDVSFVSIEVVIKAIQKFLTNDNYFVCLIKPQFEVGMKHFKNGVIKDPKIHLQVLKKVNSLFNVNNMYINKIITSPIKGGSGNKEFIALVSRKNLDIIDLKTII